MCLLDSRENGRVGCRKSEKEKSTLAKMENTAVEMPKMKATIYNLFVTNACLGSSAGTAQTYSDAVPKNAVLHQRRVENLAQLGICNRRASASKAFGSHSAYYSTSCIQSGVLNAILFYAGRIPNIPINTSENVCFRLPARDLAACVRCRCTSPSDMYTH
jgi:hypothetical protein